MDGLDLLRAYGFSLVIVSHWDNKEGGAELDTRCGLMGRARFQQLMAMLPDGMIIVGIDEHTALTMDLQAGECQVMGRSGVTLIRDGEERRYRAGSAFAISELGTFQLPEPESGIPEDVWKEVLAAESESWRDLEAEPSPEVLALVEEREAARIQGDWTTSDELRDRISVLGWQVRDTPSGPELVSF